MIVGFILDVVNAAGKHPVALFLGVFAELGLIFVFDGPGALIACAIPVIAGFMLLAYYGSDGRVIPASIMAIAITGVALLPRFV